MDDRLKDVKERHEQKLREEERERLRKLEAADLEVERARGPRPLEGFAAGPTSWTGEQDDWQAPDVHGEDAAKSLKASEEQVERASARRDPEP